MEDLIDAEEFGKNDYDWLLTPPEPPSVTSVDASKHQPSSATPSGRSNGRSVSTTRASRLSAPPSEKSNSTRPVRSSSATRPSLSNTSSYNSKTSILNTSLASATSRPSTPGNVPATARPSRQSPARSATPARTRPPPTSAGAKTARPPNNSRPSTPTSRPQIPGSSNPNAVPPLAPPRSSSRPSTPTRRPLAPSAGQPTPRPGSPGPRARAAVRPTDQILDFPVVAPPNSKTKQPERPTPAGRTRQGGAATAARSSVNFDAAAGSFGSGRRHSLPGGNGHGPEGELQRPNKVATATESSGFGRMMSKSSLDMALRHMDIRQGTGGIRGSSLFPHSIRSAAPKCRPDHTSDPVVPATTADRAVSENGSCNVTSSPDCNAIAPGRGDVEASNSSPSITARESNADVLGRSYRYDAMLLTEDSKDVSWLHSTGENSDQGPLFDHRFEPLPEPFGFV